MKNRWLLNIGLTLLVGALVLLVLYKPGAKKEAEGTPLTALTADAIQRVRLLRPKTNRKSYWRKMVRNWQLTAPRSARANKLSRERIAAPGGYTYTTRFPAAPADLGKYGPRPATRHAVPE